MTDERVIQYAFWFNVTELGKNEMSKILNCDLKFEKQLQELGLKKTAFKIDKAVDFISSNQNSNFSVFDISEKNRLDIYSVGRGEIKGVFIEYENYQDPKGLIELLLSLNPIVGYCFGYLDMALQNASTPFHFRSLGITPPAQLKSFLNKTNDVYFEISENPGEKFLSKKGIWFMSCWRTWLGPSVLKHINIEQITELDYLSKCAWLSNGILFIELYEDYLESGLPENREKQYKFKNKLDVKFLSEQFS